MTLKYLSKTVHVALTISCAALAGTASGQEGELRVALNSDFAPYHMVGPDGTIIGYNIDVLDEISSRIGRPYTIVDIEFSALIAGINSGAFDFSGAVSQITPERGESVLFTEPYIEVDFGVLTLASNAEEIGAIEDLEGRTIAVNRGSLHDHWLTAREEEYGWTVTRYSRMSDAVQAVLSGRDFAHAAGEGAVRWVAQQNPRAAVALNIPTNGEYALMFGLGEEELRNTVELALECMKLDGTIAAIHEKWMGVAPREGGLAYVPQEGFGAVGTRGYDPTPHGHECS